MAILSPTAGPLEVVVATRTDASWYAAAAILSGGLVVTTIGAARSTYRPKASLRAQPLRVRAVAAAETWLLALPLAGSAALALTGYYAIGSGAGTAWGRLLPCVGVLGPVAAACPVRAHPSWAAAANAGPLRTWAHAVPRAWAATGVVVAAGGLVLMGFMQTWDALAANVVALVVAWLHPFRPELRASPSRVGEDVGDGLLLLPGLFGATKAYTLAEDDTLLLAAVPVEEERERAGGRAMSAESAAMPGTDGDGGGYQTVPLVESPATRSLSSPGGARFRATTPSGRRPFPRLCLPRWEDLSLVDVATALYESAHRDAGAHSVAWTHDRTRLAERWSLRAMLTALLAPSTGLDAALGAVVLLPTEGCSDSDNGSRPPVVPLSNVLQDALERATSGPFPQGSGVSSAECSPPPNPSSCTEDLPVAVAASAIGGSTAPSFRSASSAATGSSASTHIPNARFETLFDRLYALGSLGLVLAGSADTSDELFSDGKVNIRYNEWINEAVYAEDLLTLPAAASVAGAASRGVAALAALERIYRAPNAAAAFYAAENMVNRVAIRNSLVAAKPPSPRPSPAPSLLLSPLTGPPSSLPSPPAAYSSSPSSSANDTTGADSDIPWPFVAAAGVLVRHGNRDLWSGDSEVPVVTVSVYSTEGIRRAVCRGLVLVQATTYAYALAGAVATELLA